MRRFALSLVALLGICGAVAFGNYTATQGSGTTFGSVLTGGVHYVQMFLCDLTTASQCASVSAGGAVKVDGSATTQPVSGTVTANLGTIGTAATAANQTSELTKLDTIITNTGGPIPTQANTVSIGAVGQSGTWTIQPGNTPNTTPWLANSTTQYPSGATPITASATGTTGATTATLAGTSGKTTYICWYSIRANATAATTVTNTITGVITGTLSSIMWVAPAASGIGLDEMIFNPCVPASATNTGIAAVSGAPGSGGLVSSKAGGYQL